MNKKLLTGLVLLGACSSLLVGCSSSSTLTDEQKTEVMNSILEFSAEGGTDLGELDKLINDNMAHFSQEEKDAVVDTYIKNMFAFVEDLNNKLSTIGYELEDVVKEYKVDINNPSTFKSIPDIHATVRGFLQELNKEGFILDSKGENSNYYIDVNIKEVLNKYSSHLSKSLKTYLEFNVYEMTSGDFMDSKGNLDLDEVAKRILTLQEGLETDKEQKYAFADKWTASLEYYYSAMLGLSHDTFISSEYVKDEVIAKYKELAEKNKDNQLGKDLKIALEILEKNGNRFDATTKQELTKIAESIFTKEIQQAIKLKYPEQEIEKNPVEDANEEKAEGTENKEENKEETTEEHKEEAKTEETE